MEILRTATERENERIQNNKEIEQKALAKDTEKSQFNWALLKNVSFFIIGAVIGAVGGKYLGKK